MSKQRLMELADQHEMSTLGMEIIDAAAGNAVEVLSRYNIGFQVPRQPDLAWVGIAAGFVPGQGFFLGFQEMAGKTYVLLSAGTSPSGVLSFKGFNNTAIIRSHHGIDRIELLGLFYENNSTLLWGEGSSTWGTRVWLGEGTRVSVEETA